jgi:hypothetical protein
MAIAMGANAVRVHSSGRTDPQTLRKAPSGTVRRIYVERSNRRFAALSLHANGVISECTLGAARLFGYTPTEMLGRAVTELLPTLGDKWRGTDGRVHPRFAFFCRCGVLQEAISGTGKRFMAALSVVELGNAGVAPLLLVIEKVENAGASAFLRGSDCASGTGAKYQDSASVRSPITFPLEGIDGVLER